MNLCRRSCPVPDLPGPGSINQSRERSLAMFKTKNDVPDATRVKAVELLNARLADCIDLQTQTKQAHWNVKGPHFIGLHELFDKINEEVEDDVLGDLDTADLFTEVSRGIDKWLWFVEAHFQGER